MATLDDLLSPAQLQTVVTRFYDAVYADPLLEPLFRNVRRERQEQRLAAFVRMTARGGSELFDGPYLREAHESLPLTDALFDHRHALLEQAIRACGHGEEVVRAFRAYDERWRRWVLPPSAG